MLDNAEHVADAVASVTTAVLQGDPSVSILVTTRVLLDVEGEVRHPVLPLALPAHGDPENARRSDAVDLFLERRPVVAGWTADELPAVVDLVRRLDGLPLAIELAAARSRHLTPAEILDHLDRFRDVLDRSRASGPRAHHSVRATIDWSYDLLDSPTRHVFERLTVFADEFGVDAAEAVGTCAEVATYEVLGNLTELVDASMVLARRTSDGERFRLLETLREYGAARLTERGELDDAFRAHSRFFREFSRAGGEAIDGPEAGDWWRAAIRERHHLAAAVLWSLGNDDPADTLQFARLLARTWEQLVSAHTDEAIEVFRTLRDLAGPADARAWANVGLATPAFLGDEVDLAVEACAEASRVFEEVGDDAGSATALWVLGSALLLGVGDTDQSAEVFGQAAEIAARADLPALEAWATTQRAQSLLFGEGDLAMIRPLLVRSETLADERLLVLQCHLAMNRAYEAYLSGSTADIRAGEEACERAITLARRARSAVYEQIGLVGLGTNAHWRGAPEEALVHFLHAAQIALDSANTLQFGIAVRGVGACADAVGDHERAARLWGAGDERCPAWPFIQRRWFPAAAQEALGARFDDELARGHGLTSREVLDLAIGISAVAS